MTNIEVNPKAPKICSFNFPNIYAHYLQDHGFIATKVDNVKEHFIFINTRYMIVISGASISAFHSVNGSWSDIASSYVPTTIEGFAHWLAAFSICHFSVTKILRSKKQMI
jgi:flagellar biosynthesis component FlhA